MEKRETGMSKRKNFGQNGKSFGQNGKKYAHGQSFQLLLSHIHKSVKSNDAVILSAKLLFFFHISKLFDLFLSALYLFICQIVQFII